MAAKVTVVNKQKKVEFTGDLRRLIKDACAAALKCEKFTGNVEIDVTIVDDEQIRAINSECRGVDSATDVLSFPLGEGGDYDINPATGAYMLGDMVLSLERAVAQGGLYGHGTRRETAYLTVHSVLHLLGYDHIHSLKEKAEMRAHEEAVMDYLGLSVKKG